VQNEALPASTERRARHCATKTIELSEVGFFCSFEVLKYQGMECQESLSVWDVWCGDEKSGDQICKIYILLPSKEHLTYSFEKVESSSSIKSPLYSLNKNIAHHSSIKLCNLLHFWFCRC